MLKKCKLKFIVVLKRKDYNVFPMLVSESSKNNVSLPLDFFASFQEISSLFNYFSNLTFYLILAHCLSKFET